MAQIHVSKSEKRSFKQYESDGYELGITLDVENQSEVQKHIEDAFKLIREALQKQKDIDSGKAKT